jgi:Inorganic H+ pyrophosphatase
MELALIFVLELGGLLLAGALARVAFGVTPSVPLRRVLSAIERASRAFSTRVLTRSAALSALVATGVLGLGFSCGSRVEGISGALGILLGAALASSVALGGSWLGVRAAGTLVARAGARFDLALGTALRAAGATGVLAQALGVLGALVLLGFGHWFYRDASTPAELTRLSALALPGYAVGGALVALVLQQASGTYAAAALTGERRGELLDPTVARNVLRNPALVSALVGERIEHGAGAARLFATAAVSSSALVWLSVELGASTPVESRFLAFPLLLWGFGLVAHGAGLFVTRSHEAQGALPALLRGQASAAGVWLVGLLGAGYWLCPDTWPALAAAGATGFVAGIAGPCATARAFARRRGALRDTLDGLPTGPAPSQATALGFGLGHAGLSLALVGAVAVAVERLGLASGAAEGGRLALMLALFAAMSLSPGALAVETGARLAETARAAGAMASVDAEALGRAQRVADSCQLPAAVARAQLTLTHGLAALAGVLALAPSGPEQGNHGGPVVLLGAGVVLAAAGAALRRAARGAREVAAEVERQLRSGPNEGAFENRAPSYRACEELAARLGLSGTASGAALVLVGPVLLGIALRLVYRESGPWLAAEALATFVAGAAVTALGVALAVDGARAVLAGARRASRPEGDPAAHAASVAGSALAEILGSAAGPAACTAAVIVTSLALLARTFFH